MLPLLIELLLLAKCWSANSFARVVVVVFDAKGGRRVGLCFFLAVSLSVWLTLSRVMLGDAKYKFEFASVEFTTLISVATPVERGDSALRFAPPLWFRRYVY